MLRDDIAATWKHRGILGIVPWVLILCGLLGWLFASNISSDFFFPRRWDVSVTLYAGLLAFNALTMALAWSGITKVYDSITEPGFANFLQHTGILAHYHFTLGFIHAVQVFAAAVTLLSVGVLMVAWIPIQIDRIALGITVGATLYALRWAYASAGVARDLAWHYATFDGLSNEERQRIRLAVDNSG